MSKNQLSNFSIIETVYKNRTYAFDLRKMFESLNLNGKIIEATLKGNPETIWNTEFFRLKETIEKLFPIALELANKTMLEDGERNVIYNESKHYFELDYIEIQKHNTSILNIEFYLECLNEIGEILYTYDNRGNVYIEFVIEDFDNILKTNVS